MEDAFGKNVAEVEKYIADSITVIKTEEARHSIKDAVVNNPLANMQKKAQKNKKVTFKD